MARRAALLVLLLAFASLASAAAVACAQEAPATPADPAAARAEAQRVARLAAHDYSAGHYRDALGRYEQAYALVPAAGLLFNIGQCHRELGEHQLAIETFEHYLHDRPDAPNRTTVADLISESRAALAGAAGVTTPRETESTATAALEQARRELEEARTAAAAHDEQRRGEYEAAVARLEEARAALETARQRDVEEDVFGGGAAAAHHTEVYEEWWFWTLIVGAVAIGAGVGIGVAFTSGSPSLPAGSLGTFDGR